MIFTVQVLFFNSIFFSSDTHNKNLQSVIMVKEINEKTFELNITHELLDVSKTIFLMMVLDNDGPEPPLEYLKLLFKHMTETRLFAEGLTQAEESRADGGYDVSINIHHRNDVTARAMFLQFKSGVRRKYSRTPGSEFSNKEGALDEHIAFSFNDAANSNQHTLLRELSEKDGISPDSVMYVFPRITEKKIFLEKLGNLLSHTSFVSIKHIEEKASEKGIEIIPGISHKFRTSYDGEKSEINLLLLGILADFSVEPNFIAEIVCICLERFAKVLLKEDRDLLEMLIAKMPKFPDYFGLIDVNKEEFLKGAKHSLKNYLNGFILEYKTKKIIKAAPNKFTTIVPEGGLRISFRERSEYESIMYQIF